MTNENARSYFRKGLKNHDSAPSIGDAGEGLNGHPTICFDSIVLSKSDKAEHVPICLHKAGNVRSLQEDELRRLRTHQDVLGHRFVWQDVRRRPTDADVGLLAPCRGSTLRLCEGDGRDRV